MAQPNASCKDQANIALTYNRDGFIAPIDVISQEEAQALRIDFETAELELSNNPEKLALLKAYPDRLLPSFDRSKEPYGSHRFPQAILGHGPNFILIRA